MCATYCFLIQNPSIVIAANTDIYFITQVWNYNYRLIAPIYDKMGIIAELLKQHSSDLWKILKWRLPVHFDQKYERAAWSNLYGFPKKYFH